MHTFTLLKISIFPIRYNKLIKLNRYEDLLYRVLDFVFKKVSNGDVRIVDVST